MELVAAAFDNLTSPAILFFILGIAAASLRSDLEIPPAIGKTLALYLMVSIGFKGGIALAHTTDWSGTMLAVAIAAILLSLLMPLLAFALLRATTRLAGIDISAVAAAYGSVSVVTFITAAAFLTTRDVPYAGYLVAVLALMEAPAIVSGLVLARRASADPGAGPTSLLPWPVLREALVSGSVLVLVGALLIGWLTADRGVAAIGGVFIAPFQGILALFLLEMGLLVVRRLREARGLAWPVFAFAIYMPLLGAALGLAIAALLGLGVGDGLLLAVLAGSASYIAVPAALRHALPQADPSVYVTLALAVTFPFNIILGIPIYYAAAQWLLPA